jgi:hypothetical protein
MISSVEAHTLASLLTGARMPPSRDRTAWFDPRSMRRLAKISEIERTNY